MSENLPLKPVLTLILNAKIHPFHTFHSKQINLSAKELNFNRLISANLSNYGKFALSKKNYKANLTAQYAPQATATKIISAFTTNPHLLLLSFFMDCIISLACLWLF